MKILLMGAGFVGRSFLVDFQDPYKFGIITTSPEKISDLKQFGSVYLWDEMNLEKILDDYEALVILVAPKKGVSYENTYLQTAGRVAKCLQNRQKPLHLIYSSSTGVYKGSSERVVTENTPLAPPTEDTRVLIEAEQTYLKIENPFVKACILRFGGLSGPGRELEKRATHYSAMELEGGEEPTNHTPLELACEGIDFCLRMQLKGLYNLVSDDHPTRKELYDTLCRQMGLPLPLWKRAKENAGYVVLNDKIKAAGFTMSSSSIL